MKRNSNFEKCTESDYQGLFASSKEELRWLCYMLTGDVELSDKALNAALEQSQKGAGGVFREWMLSWARRLIIKFCIVTVRPAPSGPLFHSLQLIGLADSDRLAIVLSLPSEVLQQELLGLDALSRFVFVLRALEGYSRRDTALLLNIDDRTCEWVYSQTVRALAADVNIVPRVEGMDLLSA
jgi:DNA-directed RNA polymerase specialized sigma24 family protein